MPWMTDREYSKAENAYEHARGTLPLDVAARLPTFNHWLNDSVRDLKWFPSMDLIEVTEAASERLRMINSPHAATLLRAWVIRHKNDIFHIGGNDNASG